MNLPKLKSVVSPVPEIIAIGVFWGVVANPQCWGRGIRSGSRKVTVRKSAGEFL